MVGSSSLPILATARLPLPRRIPKTVANQNFSRLHTPPARRLLRIIRLFMRDKICIGALLIAIGTFHAATVRQGHLWADDFAMYIHHAKNIVGGHPYTDTGYIFNAAFMVGPKYYPPIFPVLLAPVYRISGLNLIPMKLEQVLFLVLALAAIYANWKHDLGPGSALGWSRFLVLLPHFGLQKTTCCLTFPSCSSFI